MVDQAFSDPPLTFNGPSGPKNQDKMEFTMYFFDDHQSTPFVVVPGGQGGDVVRMERPNSLVEDVRLRRNLEGDKWAFESSLDVPTVVDDREPKEGLHNVQPGFGGCEVEGGESGDLVWMEMSDLHSPPMLVRLTTRRAVATASHPGTWNFEQAS